MPAGLSSRGIATMLPLPGLPQPGRSCDDSVNSLTTRSTFRASKRAVVGPYCRTGLLARTHTCTRGEAHAERVQPLAPGDIRAVTHAALQGPSGVKRLSCQEVLDQLWEYLDDEARGELRTAIDGHLHDCRHCQVEVDSIKHTIHLYRAEEHVSVPVLLSEKLMDALKSAYRESGQRDD